MKSAIAISVLLVGTVVVHAAPVRERGFSQRVTWIERDGNVAAEGLYVFRMSEERQPSRMLIVTSHGRRLVLSHSVAASGIARHTLLDEVSGWQASMETDFDDGAASDRAIVFSGAMFST